MTKRFEPVLSKQEVKELFHWHIDDPEHVKTYSTFSAALEQAVLEKLHDHTEQSLEMVVPDGWQLVRISQIQEAIKHAEVFDDGGDGADPESARSCIGILRAMLAAAPKYKD